MSLRNRPTTTLAFTLHLATTQAAAFVAVSSSELTPRFTSFPSPPRKKQNKKQNTCTHQRAEASAPRLQQLNPKVAVRADTSLSPASITAQHLQDYDVVLVTEGALDELVPLNDLCRAHNTMFYYGACAPWPGVLSGCIMRCFCTHFCCTPPICSLAHTT